MIASEARDAARIAREGSEIEKDRRLPEPWRSLKSVAAPWLANRLSGGVLGDAALREDALRRARLPALVTAGDRLPVTDVMLDHHRAMGVDHFLVLTPTPLAIDAPDVSWAQPRDGAGATALKAVNALAHRWFSGRWVAFLLPHEFLVYPHMETRRLADLAQHLDDDRRAVMHAVTVDMYGPAAAPDMAARRREHCYFDPRGYFQYAAAQDCIEVRGGPLARMAFARAPHTAPQLQRVTLAKWESHFVFHRFRQKGVPILLNRAHKPGEVSISGALLRYGALTPSGAPAPTLAGEAGFEQDFGATDLPAGPTTWFDPAFAARLDSSADLIRTGLICPGRWF